MDGFLRLTLLLFPIAMSLPGIARGEEIPWKSQEYFHSADKEPLVDLLRELAADQAIPLIISDSITSGDSSELVVSGRFGPMPPGDFLQQLTSSNGLIWYFDGSSIYVYRSNELQTQLMMLEGVDENDLRSTLEHLTVLSNRYPLRSVEKYGAVYAAGPPRYLELIQKTLDLLKSTLETKAVSELDIIVVPLHYAWADDTTLFFRDTEVTMPGVASVLTNLMSGRTPTSIQGTQVVQRPRTLTGLKGQGLLAIGQQPRQNLSPQIGPQFDQQPAQQGPQALYSGDQAVILADRRLNAVIIRDKKERLPAYKKLIESLDIPTGLVEIEATIVDVDTDTGFDWGPPLETSWKSAGVNHGLSTSLNNTDIATFAFTLLRGGQTEFAAKLKALESEGSARVVSKPSVLTLDNVEARLDNTETFYVRVAGDFEVDLFNVTVGTNLRITPHIIKGLHGNNQVKLLVHVEDGRATDENVDGIPRITESTVDTQAILNENESLLIGGLMRDESSHVENRIPILGRIPKFGYLFKTVKTKTRQVERLVMITPRLIHLPVQQGCPENGIIQLEEVLPEPQLIEAYPIQTKPEGYPIQSSPSDTDFNPGMLPQPPVPSVTTRPVFDMTSYIGRPTRDSQPAAKTPTHYASHLLRSLPATQPKAPTPQPQTIFSAVRNFK